MKLTQRKILWSLTGAFLCVNAAIYTRPNEVRTFLQNAAQKIENVKDGVVITFDADHDGCAGEQMCMSVGGYLKSIISPTPLSREESERLPSFTGERYPADPFQHRI